MENSNLPSIQSFPHHPSSSTSNNFPQKKSDDVFFLILHHLENFLLFRMKPATVGYWYPEIFLSRSTTWLSGLCCNRCFLLIFFSTLPLASSNSTAPFTNQHLLFSVTILLPSNIPVRTCPVQFNLRINVYGISSRQFQPASFLFSCHSSNIFAVFFSLFHNTSRLKSR